MIFMAGETTKERYKRVVNAFNTYKDTLHNFSIKSKNYVQTHSLARKLLFLLGIFIIYAFFVSLIYVNQVAIYYPAFNANTKSLRQNTNKTNLFSALAHKNHTVIVNKQYLLTNSHLSIWNGTSRVHPTYTYDVTYWQHPQSAIPDNVPNVTKKIVYVSPKTVKIYSPLALRNFAKRIINPSLLFKIEPKQFINYQEKQPIPEFNVGPIKLQNVTARDKLGRVHHFKPEGYYDIYNRPVLTVKNNCLPELKNARKNNAKTEHYQLNTLLKQYQKDPVTGSYERIDNDNYQSNIGDDLNSSIMLHAPGTIKYIDSGDYDD